MQKMYVANKAILVNPEGKILLLRDTGGPGHENMKAKWDFPSGRMDEGEMPREGLVREIKEEVGLDINGSEAEVFVVYKWAVDLPTGPVVGIFYKLDVDNFEVLLSDEHGGYNWIDPEEALSIDFANTGPMPVIEAIRAYIEKYL